MSKFVQYGATATATSAIKNPLNILIIVDVQNCFISGGSMGGKSLDDSIQQMKEIETLIDRNDLIVCSRDFHPMGHSSTPPFPYHCRDNTRVCPRYNQIGENTMDYKNINRTTKQDAKNVLELIKKNKDLIEITFESIDINDSKYNYSLIGTDLSYLFMFTKYAESIKYLIDDTDKIYTIGLRNQNEDFKGQPMLSNINHNVHQVSDRGKDFIQLTKGEYCEYDSFSAFAYHVELYGEERKDKGKSIGYWNNLDLSKENSTGLWEYLVKYIDNKKSTYVTITVCGLVGNICVMYTAMHGSALWEKFYKNEFSKDVTVKFIYELYGTLFYCDEGASFNGNFKSVKYDNTKFDELKKEDGFTNYDILTKSQNLVKYFEKKAEVSGIKDCEFEIRYNNDFFDSFYISNGSNIPPKIEVIKQQGQTKSVNKDNTPPQIVVGAGNIYKQKYLKYKQKYLELKNQNYL